MKIGVTHKLFLSILTAAGLAVISSVLIMQWSLSRGFLKFVNSMEAAGISRMATELGEWYRTELSWDFLRSDPARWSQLVGSSLPDAPPREHVPSDPPHNHMWDGTPPEQSDGKGPKPLPPHMKQHFDQRLFLLDAGKNVIISHNVVPIESPATPIRYQGTVVGYLGLLPRTNISEAPQQRFLKEQRLAFALTTGVVVLLSALLSLLLARRMVRPLGLLTQATHQLAAGSFNVRVAVATRDELGQLANDFNLLAAALEKSELTRRQWVADISHELRTPIAILRAEIEALQDGIRQPNRGTIHSLHGEVIRLGRLVDDLHQLSLSDVGALTYRKSELDLSEVLEETVALYQSEFYAKEIALETAVPEKETTTVFGDPVRLRQLFSNLFDNSLKYTDAGGRLQIDVQCDADIITVKLQDSPPGVPPEELGRLFERLYRVESSRNRTTGGAGLGLAICRNIVEAHNGSITALPSPLGGVCIHIELPRAGRCR